MPKKKVQHKGKSERAAGENDDLLFGKKDEESAEEEYKTVVDSEINKKYSKRLIQNNWSKYEGNLPDFESDDEVSEPPKTDDFNHLLKTASSDCSHFQFSSEKQWKSEESSLPPSNIFNLDLNILSKGLACVPFYERLGLDESLFSVEDKEKLDAEAEKNLQEYNVLREKLCKKLDNEVKVENSDNLRTLNESFRDKLDIKVDREMGSDERCGKESVKTDEIKEQIKIFDNKEGDKKKGGKKSQFFSENDEDLEDWLDSVLDD